jgi:hypothetical protein
MATNSRTNARSKTVHFTRLRRLAMICAFAMVAQAPSLLLCWSSQAEIEMMPPALQVALFRKIFPYNNGLSAPFKVLIVYTSEFSALADEVQGRFVKLGQPCESASVADFSSRSNGVRVVYVIARAVPAVVQAFCVREHVFSVSPFPALAERGEVSVAVGLKEDRKSEIIVNLGRVKAEGQSLPMSLLSLARVIR